MYCKKVKLNNFRNISECSIDFCDGINVLAGENALILIGPEGDFSPEEVRLAVENGFEEITLGTQRLRTETAAVMAVAMVAIRNSMK